MMHPVQRRYAAALARKECLISEERAAESAIIAELHLTDSTGKPLTTLYRIKEEAVFRLASDLLESALLKSGYYTRQAEIYDEYIAAADALIEWSLTLFGAVYPQEAQILREGVRTNRATRDKLIEYAFRLNASAAGGIR